MTNETMESWDNVDRWEYDKRSRSMFCRACGWNHNLHKHADDCYIAKLEVKR